MSINQASGLLGYCSSEENYVDQPSCILIVAPPERGTMLAHLFRGRGFEVTTVENSELAQARLAEQYFAAAVVSLDLPGDNGDTTVLLKHLREQHPDVVCLMASSHTRHSEHSPLHQDDSCPPEAEILVIEDIYHTLEDVIKRHRVQWDIRKTEQKIGQLLEQLRHAIDRLDCQDCSTEISPILRNLAESTPLDILGVCALDDLIDRRRLQIRLYQSEERYRDLVEKIQDTIYAIDRQGTIGYVSPAIHALTGDWPADLCGRSLIELIIPDEQAEFRRILDNLMDGDSINSGEFRIRTTSDDYRWVRISFSPTVKENRHTGFRGVMVDITERKRAEEEHARLEQEKLAIQEQLYQSQKMEAIGNLAAGVAHDFNNLLTTIQGYNDLIQQKLPSSEVPESYSDMIRQAVERASNLTRQLLLFSRHQEMKISAVNINSTIQQLLKLLRRLIGEHIILETHLDSDLWPIAADKGNIEQILMNLFLNARDAMPKGGRILVETKNIEVSSEYCHQFQEATVGKYICITLSDSGTGIMAEHLPHIFEPFFTTKKAGEGTGLGLSVVYGIIKKHKGWIHVRSEFGMGTSFQIYLPAAVFQSEAIPPHRNISIGHLQGQGEKILLIEDDQCIRDFITVALSRNGYQVFEADSSRRALDIFARAQGNFQVVLSDVILPDANGIDIANALVSENPQLKVLLSSGYPNETVRGDEFQKNGFHFLPKPYALNELLKMLKSVLLGFDNDSTNCCGTSTETSIGRQSNKAQAFS
jgi:PAS domain S-box-containing protein